MFIASKTTFLPIGGKDFAWHVIMPAATLALLTSGPLIRILRGNVIEILSADFIRACYARGLSFRVIIFKHVLKNAMNPLITILGYQLSSLLSGAAFIEIIFSWPGLGRLMLDAVLSQDLYLIMGSLVISGVLLLLGNLAADVMLAVSDPRIEL